MYTQEETAYIWLDSFFDSESRCKMKLLEQAGSALAFAAEPEKFAPILIKSEKEGVYNNIRNSLRDNAYTKKLLRTLEEKEIIAVTRASALYPKSLFALPAPPAVLYCKGNSELLTKDMFAVVGSRRTLPHMLKFTEKFCAELSEYFTLVTGVACGGDSAVIAGGLKNHNAVSVLPCGHDNLSPSSDLSLYRETVKKGLTISEYPPSVKARNYTFIARNAIIAALGKGVLAVSGGEKSGVLNTVSQALDLGKDVFAFPYNVGVTSGVACNSLIKKGAFLCENIVDILSCFGIDLKTAAREQLSADEERVIALLRENGEMHVYEMAEKLQIDLNKLSALLLFLEMKNCVAKTGGNKYAAV